jgi:glutaredoxin
MRLKNFFIAILITVLFPTITFSQSCGIEEDCFEYDISDSSEYKEIKDKVEKFANTILMKQGTKAIVKEITEEYYFFKITLDIGQKKDVPAYLTKDGKKFIPQIIEIDEEMDKYTEAHTVNKSDKPKVELFIMSYCPYGTQIEKGIIPVLKTLDKKIDFELKFCNYAMHDKKELDEQLREYCIQKQYPDKLIEYLKCFLKDGNSAQCIKEVNIDSVKLGDCIKMTDNEYKVTEKYNDKSAWLSGKFPVFDIYKEDNDKYGIAGSPALVINGKQMSSDRDPKSLFELICSGFNNPPKECNKKELSSTVPSPGFGFKENNN